MKKIGSIIMSAVLSLTMVASANMKNDSGAQEKQRVAISKNMGWKNENGTVKYVTANGNYAKGWNRLNGLIYYFDNNGKMLSGVQNIGGKTYEFNKDGAYIKEIKKSKSTPSGAKAIKRSANSNYIYDKKGNVLGTGKKYISNASAYTGDTTTASGQRPRWGTIAVDPKVIPLGSKVYIPYFDKVFIANDTGGIIRGTMIDLFMKSAKNMNNFGRRNLTIYVLDK